MQNEEILPLELGEMPDCFKKHIDDYLICIGADLSNDKKTNVPSSIHPNNYIS